MKLIKLTKNLTLAAALALPTGLMAVSPFTQANNSYIELEGRVAEVDARSFVLDYGEGAIRVELDDYNWFEEAYNVLVNDKVTVRGIVDADPNQERSIEAGEVHIKEHGLTLTANSEDEEDVLYGNIWNRSLLKNEVDLRGTIEDMKDGKVLLQTQEKARWVSIGNVPVSVLGRTSSREPVLRLGDFLCVIGVKESGLLNQTFEARAVAVRQ